MFDLLLALGRGVVKTLISVFVGAGVGLVTFGTSVEDAYHLWRQPGPPPEMFVAVGAGMLSAGAVMLVLFFVPRHVKSLPGPVEKVEQLEV